MAKKNKKPVWAKKSNDRTRCASDSFARVVYLFRLFLGLSGFDFFIPTFKKRVLTWTTFIMCALGQPALIYTMISRNRETMMRACSIYGLMMQGGVKAYTTFLKRRTLVNNVHFLRKVYERNTDRTNGNADILRRWADLFLLLSRIMSTVVIIMLPVFGAYPLVFAGTYFDPTEMLLPIFLPFVDEYTRWGAVVSLFAQFICLFLGTVGILGCDLLFMNQLLHVCPLSEMLINMIRLLDARVQVVDGFEPSELKRREFIALELSLNNVVEIQNEIFESMINGRFMSRVTDVYYINILMDIFSNAMTLCLIMYVHYFINYYVLYLLFPVILMKLFMICVLGTIVEIANDNVLSEIEQCHWYMMSVPMQHKFQLIMLKAQHPTSMLCGTAIVNLNLFVSVMKTVYSVAMLLSSFEE